MNTPATTPRQGPVIGLTLKPQQQLVVVVMREELLVLVPAVDGLAVPDHFPQLTTHFRDELLR
jgi:hypothetical protein